MTRRLRGAPAMRQVTPAAVTVRAPGRPARPPAAARAVRRDGVGVGRAMGCLLGGYAVITGLVAWMLSTGHAQDRPIQALAPISLVISVFVALGALGAVVFAGRRYLVAAIGTLGLSVGIAVASAGALVSTAF